MQGWKCTEERTLQGDSCSSHRPSVSFLSLEATHSCSIMAGRVVCLVISDYIIDDYRRSLNKLGYEILKAAISMFSKQFCFEFCCQCNL